MENEASYVLVDVLLAFESDDRYYIEQVIHATNLVPIEGLIKLGFAHTAENVRPTDEFLYTHFKLNRALYQRKDPPKL
jgi:hypothetical protein